MTGTAIFSTHARTLQTGKDLSIVFQGDGDPLEAVEVVLDTVRRVAQQRNTLAFR